MVLFNYSTKELTAKVVYYGPGLCGKTTNLQWIHEKLPIKNKGKMLSLATETDRTLFFDFLPIEIGTIRGMRTRIQLYTVPGQVFYNATRRMVLKGADCVVFVCDSQEAMLDANLESFENLRQNLEANEIDPDEIPIVFQFNKRDLPNALPIEIMNERLNPRNYPFYEAIALKGVGIEETLKGVTKLVFKALATKYGDGSTAAPAPSNPALPKVATAGPARAPAPPRANAPSPPPPPPAKKPSATIPPVAVESPDDLLDHLDLDTGLDTNPPVVVLDEEPVFAPPVRGGKKIDATMISSRGEAEDLRRRIASPSSEFDLNLEAIEEEEEEVEEISLDSASLPSLDELVPPVAAPVPVKPAHGRVPPPATTTPRPQSPPAVAMRTEPPVPRVVPAGNPGAGNSSRPVDVKVEVGPGETHVSVPIEIALEPGTTKVRLSLNLTLNVRRPR